MKRPGLIGELAIALLLCLAGGGCGETFPGEPAVILGTGVTAFEPVQEGRSLPIIAGAQNGYHIWASILTRYVSLQRTRLSYTLSYQEGGEQIFQVKTIANLSPLDESLLPPPGPGFTLPGAPAEWASRLGAMVLIPNDLVDRVNGRMVRMQIEVEDRDGRRCMDERRFIAAR